MPVVAPKSRNFKTFLTFWETLVKSINQLGNDKPFNIKEDFFDKLSIKLIMQNIKQTEGGMRL
jgi:hypothetical protein